MSTELPDAGGVDEPGADGPTVVCENVSHVYRTGSDGSWFGRDAADRPAVRAVDDVSLDVAPGSMTVLAGPSGSGKSTLLHLLAALDTPTEGRISIGGTVTAGLNERERTAFRLEHVGIVFQRFHLLPALTARANVGLPLIERGIARAERRARATDLLERVGVGDRADHRPGELSGGEQQRVAIARALVGDPTLLLADEPTGELDSETGERVLSLLREIARDRTVVVATHDPRVIRGADRVVGLRDGGVIDGGER